MWKTRIAVYHDRLIFKGVTGDKAIEFNKSHFMYYSPESAGGWVLYLTEGYPDTFMGRLSRALLHQKKTLLHLYLMSDDDHRELIELLSNLSGRPESEIRFARTFIPFYPRGGEVYNAPTETGVRKAVIVICVAGYLILLALWFICQSSKAHSAILVVAILIPFVVVAAYVVGTLELESYREARNKDRKGKE